MSGIIVGVDGSGHSQRALEWAAREAALRQASLTVLNVQQVHAGWGASPAPMVYPIDPSDIERACKLAQAETDKVLEGLGTRQPAGVTVRAVVGLPAQELVRAADGAELLVVGSLGAGGLTRALMGSVSSQVTHLASCPVVVIPSDNRQ
jgi:nucleotide-binding universal stress UspA family protein